MSVRVRVEPSGREFVAEPNEPVLEAALRAGLNLRYNCNSGTCGECRARLLRGSVSPVRVLDYPLSEAEKGQGYFLPCSAFATSDITIEAREIHTAGEIPLQRVVTRVARLERLGSHGVLHLRTPRTQTLSFLAGQDVDLLLADERRRLAVASCPCNGRVLQFHLARDDADRFLRTLFALRTGETLALEGPYGSFLLDESSCRPLVMVAEGAGFAPIKSVIEHALSLEWPRPIRLVWAAEAGGHYLGNYCRALEDAFDEFHAVLVPAAERAAVLAAVQYHLQGSDFYAAVQPALAEALIPLAARMDARLFFYP